MANGRGVRRVNESMIQDGRALIVTEENISKLDWDRIPNGTLKVHQVTGEIMVKVEGEADWIPAGARNSGRTAIAKDARILYEVFIVKRADNGDGTFTYVNKDGEERTKPFTKEGKQVFEIEEGTYILGRNKIEIYVDDMLHRSGGSGGIVEIDETRFAMEENAADGIEITVKYFEQINIGHLSPKFDILDELFDATSSPDSSALARRDEFGRIRAGAPVHEDDVARKKEVDIAMNLAAEAQNITITHDQIIASDTWQITHGLGRYPSITVVDTAGNVVVGDIKYVDDCSMVAIFTSEFSGKAYIN